jgi:hypothetical protein
MTVILALCRLRQEDHKFEASLAYIVSSRPACVSVSLKKKKKETKKNILLNTSLQNC